MQLANCVCRQGDIELYSTANVAKRQALRHSRAMIKSVKRHWDVLATKKGNGAVRASVCVCVCV